MGKDYFVLSYAQLALSSLLILVNLGISLALRLGLERSLALATVRMVVQLLTIGFVLNWLFAQDNPLIILLIALAMTLIAGQAAVKNTKRRFATIYLNSLLSILVSSGLVTSFALGGLIRVTPWYDPQYLIPLLGMVLGNTLNGISLALDRFMDSLVHQRYQIETLLTLGASRWEACHAQIREAIRVGMMPTLNSMLVMGLVSLPGMMTGQILAGASPLDAVRYQIVIVFMIAAGAAIGIVGVVLLAYQRLLSPNHQLRLDRLQEP
jgi:putative ABC transport system permease protein